MTCSQVLCTKATDSPALRCPGAHLDVHDGHLVLGVREVPVARHQLAGRVQQVKVAFDKGHATRQQILQHCAAQELTLTYTMAISCSGSGESR